MNEIIAKTAFFIKALIVVVCLTVLPQEVMGAETDAAEVEEESSIRWGLIIFIIVACALCIWIWAKEYGNLFKQGPSGILAGLGLIFLSILISGLKGCGCEMACHGIKKATELVTGG